MGGVFTWLRYLLYPKNHGNSKVAVWRFQTPCYTHPNPSIRGSSCFLGYWFLLYMIYMSHSHRYCFCVRWFMDMFWDMLHVFRMCIGGMYAGHEKMIIYLLSVVSHTVSNRVLYYRQCARVHAHFVFFEPSTLFKNEHVNWWCSHNFWSTTPPQTFGFP